VRRSTIVLGLRSAACAALLGACGGGGGGGSHGIPPGTIVAGSWTGTWAQPAALTPASGSLSLELQQAQNGMVQGTATFTGLDCVSTCSVTGSVSGMMCNILATQGDVRLAFLLDGTQAIEGHMLGAMNIQQGSACALLGQQLDVSLARTNLQEPEVPGAARSAGGPWILERGGEREAVWPWLRATPGGPALELVPDRAVPGRR
jgi:hypothetical protein